MYIVNISFFVEPHTQEKWLDFIKNKFSPFLKQSGFETITFSRVISAEPVETFTYSLMVGVADIQAYNTLMGELMDEYRTIADPIFGQNVVWLATLLKKLD